MNRLYKHLVSFVVVGLLFLGIQAHAQYTNIGGTMTDKTNVLDATYLKALDAELTEFAALNGYTIYLYLNTEILDPKNKNNLTPESIQKIKFERRNNVIQTFKKEANKNKKLNNGIVLNLDILFKNSYDENAGLESYFMQTIVPGQELNSFAKSGLSGIPQTQRLIFGKANQLANKESVQTTIDKFKAVLLEAAKFEKDNFLFGPLRVKVVKPVIKKSGGFDKYTCTADTLWLSLRSSNYEDMKAVVVNASISFSYDPKTGNYADVIITKHYTDPLYVGHLGVINNYLKDINITIGSSGNVNGTATLHTLTDRDIELQNLLVLKEGFGGDFKFTYTNSTDFSGAYDFSTLSHFEVDFIKDHQTVAKATGVMNSAGTLQGTLATTQAVSVQGGNMTVDVQKLNLQFDFSMKDGVHITSGSISAVFSGIPGFSGNVPVNATYDAYGNITAGVQANGLTLSVCTMQIVNPALNLVLDNNLDIITIEGSAKMQHPSFDTPVNINQLRWSADRGIEIFTAQGTAVYKGFKFELNTFQYNNGLFNVSARVELNTVGTTSYIDVTSFTIAEDGGIDIGSIKGKIIATLVKFEFNAAFSENRFKGGFTGEIADLISAEGAVDIGQFKPASGPSYTFCYIKIVVGSSAGIPLAPLPLKLTKFGGEYGYNYFIDYQNKSNPPTGPVQSNYILGLTLGIADVTGSVELVGNPVAQIGLNSASFTMNGTLKAPSTNPWFNVPIQAGFTLPTGEIYGGFTFDFKVPKATGSIIDAKDLGFNFKYSPTKWYIGRKGISVSLFSAINLTMDSEFSGTYVNPASYRAFMAAKLAVDWNWEASKTLTILGYNAVSAAADVTLKMNAEAQLEILTTGVNGKFSASMDASGSIMLDVCPDCSYGWTKIPVIVNTHLAGSLQFQNTNVKLHADGLFEVTILSNKGSFVFDVDYNFDPTKSGSGSTRVSTNTEMLKVPAAGAPATIPTNMPTAGAGKASAAAYQKQQAAAASKPVTANTNTNFVSTLNAYGSIRTQLKSAASQLASVEGTSVLETKLKSSGNYVLTNLNNESLTNANMLVQYAKYVKANPGIERSFATDRTAFDAWFKQAKIDISLLSAPTTLSSYPALKANITTSSSLLQSVEGTTTLQSKLQASGGYVMSKLNGEPAAVLVDYAKFLKANTGKENAFKSDNYAFDAWLKGAKSSAGTTTELTDADMSPGLVGVDGGSKELLYAKKVIAPANTLDMIIHANGSSYKFEINGSYIEGDHRVLAGWLKSQGYNTQTIRLLSCSDITSAQNLCNKLNQPVIATDGYVCIYSDGGLSVIPRNGNGDTKWYSLKPGNIRNEMASPHAPGSAGLDYVQMGGSSEMATFLSKFTLLETKNVVKTLTSDEQLSFLKDYTNAPQSTFDKFNSPTIGPKMVVVWKAFESRVTDRKDILVLEDGVNQILTDEKKASLDPSNLVVVESSNYKVGTSGNWNKDLNTFPPKKTQYVIEMYGTEKCTYNVDESGRVTSVILTELKLGPSARNPYQQARCKRIKEGSSTSPVDDGGHLIGTQFGGTGDQINYVPMPISVNRAGRDDNWYAMEQAWATYLSNRGTSTKIKDLVITVNYSGGSKKPTTFDVTWKQFNTETGDYDRNSKRINNY